MICVQVVQEVTPKYRDMCNHNKLQEVAKIVKFKNIDATLPISTRQQNESVAQFEYY